MRGVLSENPQGPDPLRGRFLLLLQVRANSLIAMSEQKGSTSLYYVEYRCALMTNVYYSNSYLHENLYY